MRKINSVSDFEAVNRILKNFYNAHPHGQEFELCTPALVVNDYDLYIAIQDFMIKKGFINQWRGSEKFIITNIGIKVIEDYNGDVVQYLRRKNQTDIEDNFLYPGYFGSSKSENEIYTEKNGENIKMMRILYAIIGLIASLITIYTFLKTK